MISSEIGVKNRVNLSIIKSNISRARSKLRVQFVVFENFSNALLQEIAREIMLLPSNNIHEKGISQRQGKRNFDSVRAICNLYSCFSFALVLRDKCTWFQQIRSA